MKRIRRLKERAARLMLAALILQVGTGSSQAVPIAIPTGDIDLTVLASISAQLNNARLMRWRTGVANQAPQPAALMTFAYLGTGVNLALPTRANPADNSANNQGDLWSDNAIEVDYRKGNSLSTAILIYTSNTVTGPLDPLGNVSLRGGFVGGSGGLANNPARASVIPLTWKALAAADLAKVSTATVSGTQPIPVSHPLYMPSQITALTGGSCPAEGPYPASTRIKDGYCDFSTHYFLDRTNSDPNNRFYDQYPASSAQRNGAFDYASLVGPFGVNTTEQGAGAGQFNPMYAVLGSNLTNAIQTRYSTTIYVEVMTR